MTTEQQPKSFITTLIPLTKWAERIATAAFIASLAAVYFAGGTSMDIARTIFMISSAILAAAYFLNAFFPLDYPQDENQQYGMKELLTMMIIPKVLWISSAVCMIGFFILSQNNDHNGHLRAWMSGGITLFIALMILAFGIVNGDKHARIVAPVAFRAVPLLVLVLFFYMNAA